MKQRHRHFSVLPVATAFLAACVFTVGSWWLVVPAHVSYASLKVEVPILALAAAIVALSTLLGWQLVIRCMNRRRWHPFPAILLYVLVTLPTPFVGGAIIDAAAAYRNNSPTRMSGFSDGSIWNGCQGIGVGFLLTFLTVSVVVAEISFAIYVARMDRHRGGFPPMV